MFRGACLSFVIFLAITSEVLSGNALWIHLDSSISEQSRIFTQRLLDHSKEQSIFQFQERNLKINQMKAALLATANQGNEPVFIQCNIADYAALLKDDEIKHLLSSMRMELLNGRLISFPFYIFGYPENYPSLESRISKLSSVQIAYLTAPFAELYGIEEADLLAMFSEMLSRPKSSIRLFREREAYTAAKGLFDGHYNLVGFYEDEPSTLKEEFHVNLQSELHANPPVMLSLDPARFPYQLFEISPTRLKYIVFSSQEEPFTEMAAVVQQKTTNLPLLISNVRTVSPEAASRFTQTLSDTYFLMVQEISKVKFNDESDRQRIQHLYLLNAYLNDPDDKLKGLGFLSYLLLMKERKFSDAREKDAYEEKCKLLQKNLHLDQISAVSILEWLGIQIPRIKKRELFTDDVSSLYQSALRKIEEGLGTGDAAKRMKNFEEAQRFLIAALLQSEHPRDVQGSRGLWSVNNYDPYYQLARLLFYMKQEKR